MRKNPRRILSSTRTKNQQLTAIVGYCHELLQVAMAFRLTHNRIAIRKPQSGLVVGTKLGTFGSEADASKRDVLGRVPKTSVFGTASRARLHG